VAYAPPSYGIGGAIVTSKLLEPDRDQIERFVDAVFRHRGDEGFVSFRSFSQDNKVFRIEGVPVKSGFKYLCDVAEDHARRCANAPAKVVFCPPLAIFKSKDHAAEKDLLAGLVLSVECDQHPQQARERLEAVLGPATAVVYSGGVWSAPDGSSQDKLHLHFRLAAPAQSADELAMLKYARDLAAQLVGGDPSNKTTVHPLRWPGSWHRKEQPIPCEIATLQADEEIDLATAVKALEAAIAGERSKANGGAYDNFAGSGNFTGDEQLGSTRDDQAAVLTRNVVTGKDLHESTMRLASRYIRLGMTPELALRQLQTLMLAGKPAAAADERWQARFDDLARLVHGGDKKFGEAGEQSAKSQNETLESARASSVAMKAVSWLWPNRFAIGKLGIAAGLPDEGKGQILCYIAARITSKTDKQWPCNEGVAPDGNVILLTAEDDPADTVVPRLAAAGADLDRVHIVKMVRDRSGGRRMFSLVSDLELLRRKALEIGNVVAVEIDPISAYFGRGKMDSFRVTDVRAVLGPLVDLAGELGVAIIAIMHFNKKVDITNALLRISDSLAFGAAARHVYGVVADTENDRKLFVRAKNNLAPAAKDKALAYHFAASQVGNDPDTGEAICAPYIIWEPDYVDVTATEAMQAASEAKSPTARDQAKKFLAELLANGPMVRTEIEDAADGNGIAERTLFRAKADLDIIAKRDGPDGEWTWQLPPSGHQRRWDDL
jgi:AAA domain